MQGNLEHRFQLSKEKKWDSIRCQPQNNLKISKEFLKYKFSDITDTRFNENWKTIENDGYLNFKKF
jgi:hypothetical protein